MQLSIRLVPVADTTLVIVLTGELDATTRPVLAAFLDPIPHSPVIYVVVATAELWFCDLPGLDLLALTHRALQVKGGHLAVAEARPPLRRLIDLMAQHDTLPPIAVYTSMAAALSATDVEVCQIDGPPAPLPRHLPRVRELARRPHHRQAPARGRPRAEPADPPAANAVRLGYIRVATRAQDHAAQLQLLNTADCREIVEESGSTRRRGRPQLTATVAAMRRGDTLVITKPGHLARSMKELLVFLEDELAPRGINLHILTGTCVGVHRPSGQSVSGTMLFRVSEMAAEMARDLICERTREGTTRPWTSEADPAQRMRWYTKAELDAVQIVKRGITGDLTGDVPVYWVIVAGELLGTVTRRLAGRGWHAYHRNDATAAHTGKGAYPATRDAAVLDLMADVHHTWRTRRDHSR